jgi:hypothetical protein
LIKLLQRGVTLGFLTVQTFAGGISVDAGLTPAEDRWIVRLQARQMNMSRESISAKSSMTTQAAVLMTAYGFRSNITLIMMQGWLNRESNMMGNSLTTSGYSDLNLILKYRIYRHNTEVHTLGLAATSKITLPSGGEMQSDGYWSMTPGLFLSLRLDSWALDASATYKIQNLFSGSTQSSQRGYEFKLDGAIARQISIRSFRSFAIAPVLEGNLGINKPDRMNNESVPEQSTVFFLSPGLKVTYSSFILEGLLQYPVLQDVPENLMQQGVHGRFGLRYMF